jgi:hypothetical protein
LANPGRSKSRTAIKKIPSTPDIKSSPFYQRPKNLPGELIRFKDGLKSYQEKKVQNLSITNEDYPDHKKRIETFKLDWQVPDDGRTIYERGVKSYKENQDRRQELYLMKMKQE